MAEQADRGAVPSTRRRLGGLLVAALLAVVALTGCSSASSVGPFSGERVDPPFQVSSQALTDDTGQPFSLTRDDDKRLTLVFFGYTHCPDICPLVMSNLAAAMTRLDDSDRSQVRVVFITSDPARDTGPVLRRWLDHVDPSFLGVTGSLADISAVAKSVGVGIGSGTKLPSGGRDLGMHGTQVIAVDQQGKAPVYWGPETTAQQFAEDIHTLLGKPS